MHRRGTRAEVFEGACVTVEERHLIATVVEPGEVATRVHEPHQELPRLATLAVLLDGDLEEVHLRLVAGTVHQRHEHLRLASLMLAPVAAHQRDPDLVPLFDQLPV